MAKNNINLGTLSGKLGDNVFWRTHGQQRVRTYFKRTETNVGYEAAMRRSQFANLKSIYQWLPEPFRKACNLYRPGGNPYADFMRQYTAFSVGRDKEGFGAGRFLPVNCTLSNGTFGVAPQIKVLSVRSAEHIDEPLYTTGVVFSNIEREGDLETVANYSMALMETYPFLRDGDRVHVYLGFILYTLTPWGESDAVQGFPFPYSQGVYMTFTLDRKDSTPFEADAPLTMWYAHAPGDYMDMPGFALPDMILQPALENFTSMCAAVMFERPTNTRQARFSPSVLAFNKSQLMILSPTMRGRWNEYAARSYMKE